MTPDDEEETVVMRFTRIFELPPDADLSNPPWSLLGSLDLESHLRGTPGAGDEEEEADATDD